ncbi:hypothetical protein [Pseudomonas prosekii]|uniref:hypothetical protein n=1 Tax=Pseudomonas prosekii TaxID=1148509 RepID=UPI0011EB2DBC|nr:hypothetical protein [Pseudomonas prosekii]
MNAYTGDVETMDKSELVEALRGLADSWSKHPEEQGDFNQGRIYGELRSALEQRFSEKYEIKQLVNSTQFAVVKV